VERGGVERALQEVVAARDHDGQVGLQRQRRAQLGLGLLTRQVEAAKEAGQLRADTDTEQLLFEIDALATNAGLRHQLVGDPKLHDRAVTAIAARLRAAAPSA
jgi:hypothetical protein